MRSIFTVKRPEPVVQDAPPVEGGEGEAAAVDGDVPEEGADA